MHGCSYVTLFGLKSSNNSCKDIIRANTKAHNCDIANQTIMPIFSLSLLSNCEKWGSPEASIPSSLSLSYEEEPVLQPQSSNTQPHLVLRRNILSILLSGSESFGNYYWSRWACCFHIDVLAYINEVEEQIRIMIRLR